VGGPADRRSRLASARAELLERPDVDLHDVPARVAASWRRSVASGVHPTTVISEYYPDLDFDSRLVRCARPVIEQLVEQIGEVPTCVALTDQQARLLVRADSTSSMGRIADAVHFAQGFDYAEGAVGTNGVGTVLEAGESVHIVGGEHFAECLQPYACAGAPVRDPYTGRLEGVLDISCLAEHSSPIMHSLVRTAAARIERGLLADRNQLQQALFDVYTRVDARSKLAVLAVGERTVMANSPMQGLLEPGDLAALQEYARFVMLRRSTVDDVVDLPSGSHVRMRGSTVTVGGAVAGMVGVVTLLAEVSTPSRPAGGRRSIARPESGCPAWRAAWVTADEALRADDAVLVIGEPGTGRFTLLSHVYRQAGKGRVVAVEAAEVESGAEDVVARIRREPSTVLVVLRDIDRLSEAAAARPLAVIGDQDSRPLIAATAAGPADGELLTLFQTSVTVPPLRNRASDLPALVDALLAELAPQRRVGPSREAQRLLQRYGWPGNLRQLREALEFALRRRPVGRIEVADLPAFCQSSPRVALRPVDEVERDAIVTALRDARGNRVAAAAALGLARSSLYRKIRQYGITV
jgi:sigma-54 dependent transcriptional regulator, acetoin dehydrogenase operon transcriptional activator AcoR